MRSSLLPLVRFELSRLGRPRGFWIVWGALAAWAAVEAVNLPGDLPSPLRLWALPVVYLAGWALAGDLRSGALDVLLGNGVTLPRLLLVRFAAAAAVGLGSLGLLALPVILRGGSAAAVIDLAVVVVYWAALGAALGFFAGAGGLAALAAAGGFVELWWLAGGSVWLVGGDPTEGFRAVVSVLLHLGSPFPAAELPFGSLIFPREWLRLAVAAVVVGATSLRLSRLSLFVRGDV